MTEGTDPAATPTAQPAAAALAACPHLFSVDGPWHAAAPSRAHRCQLLAEGRPTLDRQREHCLGAAHVSCPTWLERHGADGPLSRPGPFVVMAPVVLEGPGIGLPSQASARQFVAPATVVVVGAALGALVLARGPLAPGSSGAGDGRASPTPAASSAAVTAGPASTAAASASPAPSAAPGPTPTARPTSRPRTYKVRPGDNLTAIAARFGTTVAVLKTLNNITNPSLIRTGQVLKLP